MRGRHRGRHRAVACEAGSKASAFSHKHYALALSELIVASLSHYSVPQLRSKL